MFPLLSFSGVGWRMQNCGTGKRQISLPWAQQGKGETPDKGVPLSQDCATWVWGGEQRMFNSFPHSLPSNGRDSGSCHNRGWKSKLTLPPNVRTPHPKSCSCESRDDVAEQLTKSRKRGEGLRYLKQRALCEFSVSLALCFVLSMPRILNLSTSDFVSRIILSYEGLFFATIVNV